MAQELPRGGQLVGVSNAQANSVLEDANVPTLLMLLVQMTGDLRWLEGRFIPTRGKGLSENDSGGLPEEVQAEIREAARDAIVDWKAGTPLAIPEPSPELLVQMLSVAVGEPVPSEYGEMIAADLSDAVQTENPREPSLPPAPLGFHVAIVGAGVSGLIAAAELRRNGVRFTVLEKNDSLGGTWYENRYPGAAVDVPSHLYSFASGNRDWPTYYANSGDLHQYLTDSAKAWDVERDIRLSCRVERAEYSNQTRTWTLTVRDKDGQTDTLEANVVISAVGAFGNPRLPEIPGLAEFAGRTAHTARWPQDLDLAGQRVGVIGNGASAMQLVPAVAPQVSELKVFQRTPHWIAPFEKFGASVPDALRALLQDVPLYRAWYRQRLAWVLNDTLHDSLQKDPTWQFPERSLNAKNEGHRRLFLRYLENELAERADLIPKVTPTYPPFGKRILLDNGWFKTLQRDNVELVTDGIDSVNEAGVRLTSGRQVDLDCLLFATGFDVVRFIASMDVVGASGMSLRDAWDDDDAQAYIGVMIPDFPNFFAMYGPNTQAGHGGSLIFYLECQMRYITDLLRQMFDRGLAAVDVRQDVYEKYNAAVAAAHENMIWTHGGMDTYYRNSKGRIVVSNPWRVIDFWYMTRRANLDEYRAIN